MDNQIVVSDYTQMDRVLREERAYILNLVKQIKKTGCNVLLIQKSILRYVYSSNVLAVKEWMIFGIKIVHGVIKFKRLALKRIP